MEANRRIFLANHAESYTTRYLCIALFMSGMIDKKRKTRKDFQFSLYFKACTFNASVMIEFSHSHEVAVKINRINRLKRTFEFNFEMQEYNRENVDVDMRFLSLCRDPKWL